MGTLGLINKNKYHLTVRKNKHQKYRNLRKKITEYSTHIEFSDKKNLSSTDLRKIKDEIRRKIIKERQTALFKTIITLVIVVFLLSLIVRQFLRYMELI